MAAVTHGLTSRRVLLRNESEEEFLALRDLLVTHFEPGNPYEVDLVEQLVAARWRLDRVSCLETALLEVEIGRREPEIQKEFDSCGYDIRNALAFRALFDESRVLAGLSRYESRFRRACDKLTKKLDAIRAIRKLHEEPRSPNGTAPQPPDPTHVATEEVGQASTPAAGLQTRPAASLVPEPRVAVPLSDPQPQSPARTATVPCVFRPATGNERRAGRRRPPKAASSSRPLLKCNQGMLSR